MRGNKMGISVSIQGILQGFNNVYKPLIISLLRLIVLVLPLFYLFSLVSLPSDNVRWSFPIVEIITVICSVIMLLDSYKKLSFSKKI